MLLSDICEIIMGQSPSSDSYNVKGQGLPFFQGNADFGKLYPSVRLWCNCPIKKAEAGDLLVSVRAPIGAVNLANQKCCIGRGLAALRPYRDKCDAMYLYYLIKAGKNKLNWLGTGSTFKAITRSSLLSFNVPDYCIAFQRKISGKLWSVDKLIHQRNEQLKLFDLLIQSRFLELFGDPNDVSILSLPGEKKSIEDVCDGIYGGGTPSKSHKEYYTGKIPWVTPKDMKTLSIDDSQNHINSEAIENSTAKLIPKRCVLMVIRSGILKHTLPVAINNVEVTINQDMKAFVPSSLITPEYLLYTFKLMEKSILSKVRGVTADNIEFSEFRKRRIVVPPIEVQTQFVDFALSIDKSKYREAIFLYLLEDIRICCNI